MLTKVKCNSCQMKVDSIAKTCAHCGAEDPGKGKSSLVEKAIPLIVLFLMFWGVLTLQGIVVDWYHQWSKDGDAETAEKEAACKADLQCWGDKFGVASDIACGPAVERLAKYSFRWTTGTLDTKFSNFRWLDRPSGYLTYIGGRLELQNGFGAYQNVIYTCDYDPIGKRVMNVSVKPGRL